MFARIACFIILPLLGAECAFSRSALSHELLTQRLDPTVLGRVSNHNNDTHELVIAENFLFDQVTAVEGLSWFGGFESGAVVRSAQFHVRFFNENQGLPSSTAWFDANLQAQASPTSLRFPSGQPIQEFTIERLSDPVVLQANTTYWLSIVGRNSETNAFLWGAATGMPGDTIAQTTSTGAWEPTNGSQALTLWGVPEPAVLAPWGVAFVVITVRYRSVRSRTA